MDTRRAYDCLRQARKLYKSQKTPAGGWILGSGFASQWYNDDVLLDNNDWYNAVTSLRLGTSEYVSQAEIQVIIGLNLTHSSYQMK
jgi:hypothetical protein